ncbi:sulfatase family protein [Dyadobacter aurulentus]|uniref:sulfatase family protein n=1 Tax=Dyadobacter sp. UC 10 TaxID=2605428 RepID=UPI0011F15F83|nr:sulfatase [Dyadobacter sp. UC 10]KAA0992639.1 sulfatase [Dyadobacter sp. UC 10]
MRIVTVKRIVVLCWLVVLAVNSFAQKRPNILWITIEDTSPKFIGCYGNKDARTPAIDRLAKDGVRFTNAFSTGTVCSPSRTALITGVKTYETGTGNHRSNYTLPANLHGFPYYMQLAGYHTSNNAKTDYNVFKEKQFIADAWNESSAKAGWWNRQPGQPFFSVFNYNDSHQSRTMTDAYDKYVKNVLDQLPENERIAENAFEMPPIYRDSPEMRKQFARVYNSLKLTDNKIARLLKRLDDDHLRDSTIIFFFGDHGEGIPRGKTNGIDLGYRVPFVIWFPPMYKHLSPWGASGMVADELIDFEDLAPTLISLAGGKVPDYMKGRKLVGPERSAETDHLILSSDRSDNGIDMIRSVTDGRYMYSRNFLPFMPEVRYIRYMEISEMKQQMRKDLADNKLDKLQSSLFAERPAEFLFDVQNDPWETKNLINGPELKSVAEKMRRQLSNALLKSRDVMFLPEYEIGMISQTGNAYDYRLSDQNYPVKEIFASAELSGKRGKDIASRQIKLLKNTNKIVRYWAALGLRSQSADVLKSFEKELVAAMEDNYQPVSITASAIVYDVFKNEKAAVNLNKSVDSDNAELALMSINYLLYISDKKPFIETIRSVQKVENRFADESRSRNYKVKAACMDFLGSLGLVPNNPDYAE